MSGGAEKACRDVAERLADHFDIDVLTTCALDYDRWRNDYPAGETTIEGVRVHRYPVAVERDPESFAAFSSRTIAGPHGTLDELQWLLLQGPSSPALLQAIQDGRQRYDLYVFWIYLYFPTFFGLPLVADKAVFVPLAHDEPPFHLEIFRPLYYLPRAIIYHTAAERDLVHRKFGGAVAPGTVIGSGVEPPAPGDATRFRRRFGIADDFILYVGRVNRSKGCDELFDLFATYKALRPGRQKLILIGNVEMSIPQRIDIRALGYLDDQAVADALAACSLSVTASRFESFSLTVLESWLAERPVLANRDCAPIRAHVEASGGGLLFDDAATFCAALDRLSADAPLRRALASRGHNYVKQQYGWNEIVGAWRRALNTATRRKSEVS